METLLQDYKRRLKTVMREIEKGGNELTINRLGTKASCYRTFISELERDAPIVFWQRFDRIKPQGDAEYLVCNTDGVIRVSYFDGVEWGYSSLIKENITHWAMLPSAPTT
jgi:hypothetical protein